MSTKTTPKQIDWKAVERELEASEARVAKGCSARLYNGTVCRQDVKVEGFMEWAADEILGRCMRHAQDIDFVVTDVVA